MVKKRVCTLLLSLAAFSLAQSSAARSLDYESPEEIPYDFVMSDGPSTRMRNGATVYKGKPRGFVDDEPMIVVIPMYRKKIPPRVDVIAYTEQEAVAMVWDTKRRELVGEDKIFARIDEDLVRSRCEIYGQDCDQTPEFKKLKAQLYPPVEPPAFELEVTRDRNKVRVQLPQ